MKFLDQKSLLEAIQNEASSSQLTFQIVDSSVLSFSMLLPYYLNTPQINPVQNVHSQVSDYDLLSNILID